LRSRPCGCRAHLHAVDAAGNPGVDRHAATRIATRDHPGADPDRHEQREARAPPPSGRGLGLTSSSSPQQPPRRYGATGGIGSPTEHEPPVPSAPRLGCASGSDERQRNVLPIGGVMTAWNAAVRGAATRRPTGPAVRRPAPSGAI
jgi:hypothetical protein